GVPQLVWLEEPHTGVQFGVHASSQGGLVISRRTATGEAEQPSSNAASASAAVPVPVRASHPDVVAVSALRRQLHLAAQEEARQPGHRATTIAPQTGSAAFAIELLQVPWRQRFEGAQAGTGAPFAPTIQVADRVLTLDVSDITSLLGR